MGNEPISGHKQLIIKGRIDHHSVILDAFVDAAYYHRKDQES
jgi:hypothetical protein